MGRHSSRVYVIYNRFGDRVGVLADVVFVAAAIFADMIGQNRTAVLQMDGVSPCAGGGQQPYGGKLPYKEEDGDTQAHSGAF